MKLFQFIEHTTGINQSNLFVLRFNDIYSQNNLQTKVVIKKKNNDLEHHLDIVGRYVNMYIFH